MVELEQLGATVTHDVVLTGNSGATHQIDVLVEFTAADIPFKAIVSCKDHAGPAEKSHVLELHGVMNDLPGQPRGILVSKNGFRKGAVSYARHHGIQLYHLSEPTDADWEGLIREVSIVMTLEIPRFVVSELTIDEEWAAPRIRALGMPLKSYPLLPRHERLCVWESGKTTSWNDIFYDHMPKHPDSVQKLRLEFNDDDRPMISLERFPLRHAPLTSVTVELSYSVRTEAVTINLGHMVAYCFRDVLASDSRFIGADGGAPQ